MRKFWIQFGERWSRDAEKKEKKDKSEKEVRKFERKALRTLQKRLETLIKEVRKNGPDEDPIPWWIENMLQCLEILQTQIKWLIGREEELDEP